MSPSFAAGITAILLKCRFQSNGGMPVADRPVVRWTSGSALITSLITVAILGTFAVAALGVGINSIKSAGFWASRTKARYAAESGVAHAVDVLAQGQRPASLENPPGFPAEGISYHVSISYPFPRAAEVSSQASVMGRSTVSRTARARVRISGLPLELFDDLQDPEAPDGIIGSACQRGQYREVTFDKQMLTPPPHTGPGTQLSLTGKNHRLGPGAFAFSSIQLSGNSALLITGPARVYVNGDVILNSQSSIRASGPLTLFIRGRLEIRNASVLQAGGPSLVHADSMTVQNGRITPAGPLDILITGNTVEISGDSQVGTDPPDTVIYLTTDTAHRGVDILALARVYAGIYAPGTPVSIAVNSYVAGSVVGCPVTLTCVEEGLGGGDNEKKKKKKRKQKKCATVDYDPGIPDYIVERGTWDD